VILGVGVDLVHIPRVARLFDQYGGRFAMRLLGPLELEDLKATRRPVRFLAMRFAAKEAFVKALGTGFRHGIGLAEIEVRKEPDGRPTLALSGLALVYAERFGVARAHLSLTDEADTACAFVVLERPPLIPIPDQGVSADPLLDPRVKTEIR
jgi:holo-[acyl-carrier protein] synthase